jgi:hypothetical protein
MEDALISATKFYNVRPNQPISLTVEIGDNQVGGTAVRLNGVSIPVNQIGATAIGSPGQDLRRSVLQVVTTVKDQNPLTNNTSVNHRFTGGKASEDFPFEVSVKTNGGVARYFITYILA